MTHSMDGSFTRFAERETSRLLGLAHAMTGNTHDAWDLVQETLVRMATRWSTLDEDYVSRYATTVLVRLNTDRFRRARREVVSMIAHDRDRAAPPVQLHGDIDPDLVAALAGLSPRQRTALALRYLEDLDVATIADRMGCSTGSVKTHLHRAEHHVRGHLASVEAGQREGARND